MTNIDCFDCMFDAPYWYCCRLECGEHEFCKGCTAESSKATEGCPNKKKKEED